MTPTLIGLLSIGAIILLIQFGMHVAIALLLVSFVGVGLIKGDFSIAGKLLAQASSESIANYSFGTIPLFVVMGLLVGISGIGRDTFDVAGQLFRVFRGGLGMATVAANAVFAAVNGTSIASASVFTRIAVPELMRLGYTPKFAVGVVAGSSVLGMLIPPSLLLILFGIVAETSIGDLFTAGILPGVLLALAYCVLIAIMVRISPAFVEARPGVLRDQGPPMSVATLVTKSAPVVLLVLVVLGGIYGGVFTPIEAGAVGALASLLLALQRRALTGKSLGNVLTETGYVTAAISFLLVAAHLYATMLALSGMPNVITEWVQSQGFGFWTVVIGYIVIILLLGTILDSGSIILIVVPLTLPLMQAFGADIVWFGIVTIIAVEIGLLTPPLGVACFVVKANLPDPSITLGDVFSGSFPFVVAMTVLLGLVTAFPWLSLALVR
jgi:tripartite ATP-independent transporter DctM subunit